MELCAGFAPATINRFSVQYHLRCRVQKWKWIDPSLHSPDPQSRTMFISDWAAWVHVVFLLGLVAWVLTAATAVLQRKQLTTSIDD